MTAVSKSMHIDKLNEMSSQVSILILMLRIMTKILNSKFIMKWVGDHHFADNVSLFCGW